MRATPEGMVQVQTTVALMLTVSAEEGEFCAPLESAGSSPSLTLLSMLGSLPAARGTSLDGFRRVRRSSRSDPAG